MMLEFSRVLLACIYLGGGFNDFLCSPLLGEMIPFGLVQPPTRYILFIYIYAYTFTSNFQIFGDTINLGAAK